MRIKDPPLDLDLDAYGNLFVASPNRVLIVDQRGGEVLTVDGPRSPGGILVKDKRLFVTDPDLDRVLVFDIGYSEE